MAISLDTSRRPATRWPSESTITMSDGRIMPLLMAVGVDRTRPLPRRTERLPSVAATYPRSCSILPRETISRRYRASQGMREGVGGQPAWSAYGTSHPWGETILFLHKLTEGRETRFSHQVSEAA